MAMRFADFHSMGRAAQLAKVRARWIVELQILKREAEWNRLRLRTRVRSDLAWMRAHVKDALILAGIILADAGVLRLLYLFGLRFFHR